MDEEIKDGEKPDGREFTEVEKVAMEIGWNPDFEGEGAKTAAEYIKASRDITDAYRKQNKSVNKMLGDANDKISRLEEGFLNFKEMMQAETEAKLKASEEKIKSLQQQRERALDEEDVPAVRKIESEIRAESAAIAKTQKQGEKEEKQTNPEFPAWLEKNQWYGTNREMTLYAEAQLQTNPSLKGLSAKRVYAKIEKLVKEEFPEEFENEKPEKKNAVESGGGGGRTSAKVGYNDLDATAKREVDDMLETMPEEALSQYGKTKAEQRAKFVQNMVARHPNRFKKD